MNIVLFYHKVKKRLSNFFSDFYFRFFILPLYHISFNSKGNRFKCYGRIRRSKVLLDGGG